MSNLRLSPEDQAEYAKLSDSNEQRKQAAIARGDAKEAKQCRQYQSHLYNKFSERQLPGAPVNPPWETLTLIQRVERIEEHLKLGVFAL